jgi:ubiquinone/menaquinone biosynthesis C-methylase UbiE
MLRFDDGAGYERTMGTWSRLAGEVFLDWLAPPQQLRWIDIGCGNGAFTELLVDRCAPIEVHGLDPSEGQLAFARKRLSRRGAAFCKGDAMALPYADGRFDAAVMALVVVFVPDPRKGLEEMVRVVRPGGTVATYVWDMLEGGFPLEPILAGMRAMGLSPPSPPRSDASRIASLRDLWIGAGLEEVETRQITVQRTFADFDDFWLTNLASPTVRPVMASLTLSDAETLKDRIRSGLCTEPGGHIALSARANLVKGVCW